MKQIINKDNVCTFEESKVCDFDKRRDLQEVEQTGFVNLVQALGHNVIDGNLELDDEKFNGIEEPAAILGRPKDGFDAMHYRETISGYKAPSNNPSGESAPPVE